MREFKIGLKIFHIITENTGEIIEIERDAFDTIYYIRIKWTKGLYKGVTQNLSSTCYLRILNNKNIFNYIL